MRAALISLNGQPTAADSSSPYVMAGKSIAQRQLEFALAAGAESIIAVGDGASPEAIALRHAVEAAGARFQAVRGSHNLLGAARADDELLVLVPGLVPEAPVALEGLRGSSILVFSAPVGIPAGFERIDAERAWAGALTLPGRLVERLAELTPDAEPAPALLRIALQAGLKERRVPDGALSEGAWTMVQPHSDQAALERAWLIRRISSLPRTSVSEKLSHALLGKFGLSLLRYPRARATISGGVLLALFVAIMLAWFGSVVTAFAILGAGVLLADLRDGLAALQRASITQTASASGPPYWPLLIDLVFAACAAGAIHGEWLNRLFPPAVLLAALRTNEPTQQSVMGAVLRDRLLLALFFTAAAWVDLLELGVMLASLGIVALKAIKLPSRG